VTVSPADAEVAARSFPRRWRELFARAAKDPSLLERAGVHALADAAASSLLDTADQLPGGRTATAASSDALARIADTAEDLAHAIAAVPTDEWGEGRLEAMSDGIEHAAALLRQAERAVDAEDED
jgi:hypothetical protein